MATNNPPDAMAQAPRTVGQVMKITAINGNTVTLDRPLHYTYKMSLTVQVNRFKMVEQVGLKILPFRILIRVINPISVLYIALISGSNVYAASSL
jgi:hypothetical protein